MWNHVRTALTLGALLSATACSPYVITDITLGSTTAKLTYSKTTLIFPKTGIVECQRAEDGSLSNCAKMNITFRKPGQ